ncbi:MAG: NADP-dependent malic enzyme [Eubacteriales bacterium]|nr:NADP-dependent malic enzyme [Eubacteriales bacterium]
MDYYKESLKLHELNRGKLAITSKVPLKNKDDLSLAYTPGVAQPCLEIKNCPEDIYRYTAKGNMVAVVTDGSAVLGLGNIGAKASLPVMEGKAVLFKEFGGIDAIPICIETQNPEEIICIIKNISTGFGGINLEDISAPRCFEIEEKLQSQLDIPVFHDDQHGTAIVTSAALINALKVVGKNLQDSKVVINGAGAAGVAIAKMLLSLGITDLLLCNRSGILCGDRPDILDSERLKIAKRTNPKMRRGSLADAVKGADIFIGVSGPGVLTGEMIETMNQDSVIFAMSNPEPEVLPEIAIMAGAKVIGTGRSDYPNQINNVLAFPGLFKGALSVRAKKITETMKAAAAYAIAGMVKNEELSADYIIPSPLRKDVADAVAAAVADAWRKEGEPDAVSD